MLLTVIGITFKIYSSNTPHKKGDFIMSQERAVKSDHIINEKLPMQTLGILGFQHVLVMYSGAVVVPLILSAAIGLSAADTAFLISADLFTCGIATLLQVVGVGKHVGIKLPI